MLRAPFTHRIKKKLYTQNQNFDRNINVKYKIAKKKNKNSCLIRQHEKQKTNKIEKLE